MSVEVDGSEVRPRTIFAITAQVVLVSVVAIIGWNIALPGLDPAFMESQLKNGVPSQLSLLALGVGSILTAFALGQIAVLIAPRLEKSTALFVIENIVALLVAVSQAYGIAYSGSTMGLLADDSTIGLAIVTASLVGGVAIMLFLSRLVALPRLVAGFWIVWILPALIGLPGQLSSSVELVRSGAIGEWHLVGAILVMAVAAALIVFATRTVMQSFDKHNFPATTKASVAPIDIVVWPPFLAASAGGYLLMPLVFLAPDSVADAQWLRVYVLVVTSALIPIFVLGYRRFFARKGLVLPIPLLMVLVVVQVALMLGGEFVAAWTMLPLPLNGTTLLVLVVIVYALIDATRGAPRSDTTLAGLSRKGVA